jgi:hypothetical protein
MTPVPANPQGLLAASEGHTLTSPPESLPTSTISARGRVAVSTRYAYRASAPEQGPVCLNPSADAHRRSGLGATNFWNKKVIAPSLDSHYFVVDFRGRSNSTDCCMPRGRGSDAEHRVECR